MHGLREKIENREMGEEEYTRLLESSPEDIVAELIGERNFVPF